MAFHYDRRASSDLKRPIEHLYSCEYEHRRHKPRYNLTVLPKDCIDLEDLKHRENQRKTLTENFRASLATQTAFLRAKTQEIARKFSPTDKDIVTAADSGLRPGKTCNWRSQTNRYIKYRQWRVDYRSCRRGSDPADKADRLLTTGSSPAADRPDTQNLMRLHVWLLELKRKGLVSSSLPLTELVEGNLLLSSEALATKPDDVFLESARDSCESPEEAERVREELRGQLPENPAEVRFGISVVVIVLVVSFVFLCRHFPPFPFRSCLMRFDYSFSRQLVFL